MRTMAKAELYCASHHNQPFFLVSPAVATAGVWVPSWSKGPPLRWFSAIISINSTRCTSARQACLCRKDDRSSSPGFDYSSWGLSTEYAECR